MQSFLFFLPSRRLLWRTKSVQGERRTKQNAEFFVFLAEPLPLWRSKSVQGERKANISAYGPSGRRCSPEAGELRVAVRGMNFCIWSVVRSFFHTPSASLVPLPKGDSSIRFVRTLRLLAYIPVRSVRTLCSAICKLIPFPSAYGPSGRRCSPKVGELRVAVRGMNF